MHTDTFMKLYRPYHLFLADLRETHWNIEVIQFLFCNQVHFDVQGLVRKNWSLTSWQINNGENLIGRQLRANTCVTGVTAQQAFRVNERRCRKCTVQSEMFDATPWHPIMRKGFSCGWTNYKVNGHCYSWMQLTKGEAPTLITEACSRSVLRRKRSSHSSTRQCCLTAGPPTVRLTPAQTVHSLVQACAHLRSQCHCSLLLYSTIDYSTLLKPL